MGDQVSDVPTSMISRLIPRYAEPHRRYHTWSHIGACFEAAENLIAPLPLDITLALLYHDAVYDPERRDNETRSAALLMDDGERARVDAAVLKRARAMVLATMHAASPPESGTTPESEDARIVVDADLSILAASEVIFDKYEDAIREEYKFVDDAPFAAGRAKIMQSFLDREQIFRTRIGRDMWEEAARANLKRSVERWA
jgi:predicted metal-dependent HD superfamily phosphohydrolase